VLEGVQAKIAALWEAAAPPSDTARAYVEARREFAMQSAASSHRRFWFEPQSGTALHAVTDYDVIEHSFLGVVHVSLAGKDVRARFVDPINEALVLMRAINTASLGDWPTGTRGIKATRYETIDLEEVDGTTIVISIEAQTEET
jgi:hypothetical protein